MGDNLKSSAKDLGSAEGAKTSTRSVNLKLPLDILEAISQRAQQSGQSQTEVLITALRSGLSLNQIPAAVSQAVTSEAFEELSARLNALEPLVERVGVLEGKLIAS